ncbi:FAD/NAD(P)-binding protein [Pseudomonas trivialis]|uniref:FAD/NAD(P)-binding protein n=1 Tax=Pseudomonas trivialis TaxID=200450 RepID=UPI0030CD5F29
MSFSRSVAIIGGSVTGVAAFIALVRTGKVRRIDLIDPQGLADSIAFTAAEQGLLCNTSVQTMSVLDDDPHDFQRYLHGQGIAASEDGFVPRAWVSGYLKQRYAEYRDLAEAQGIEHRVVRATVRRIKPVAPGRYQLQLNDGADISASAVLVCTGSAAPCVPPQVAAHVGAPGIFTSPYPTGAWLQHLHAPSRVLVLGSRLSAVDSALLLCGAGHRVLMASPSGRLPGVRTATPRRSAVALDEARFARLDLENPKLYWHLLRLLAKAAKAINGRSLREQIDRSRDPAQRLRGEIALASRGATDWQNLLVHCMDLADLKLRAAPATVRMAALQNCWEAVGRYLFAVPLQTAVTLSQWIDEGRLQLAAHVPTRLEWQGQWIAHDDHGNSHAVDAVVCASGFHKQPFHATPEALELQAPAGTPCIPPVVSAQLQVSLPGADRPDNIWLLGVASYLAAPMVNSVYQSVRQAAEVALMLSEHPAFSDEQASEAVA